MTSLSNGRCQWKEQLLLGTLGQGTLIGPMRTNHHPRKQEKVRAEIFRKEALAKIKEMKSYLHKNMGGGTTPQTLGLRKTQGRMSQSNKKMRK
jgi:hypothetical protein